MKNKVLVKLIIPEIDETYDVFLPVNKRIGNIVILLTKSVMELGNGIYNLRDNYAFYNRETGQKYNEKSLIRETDIRNGTNLIMM